MTKLFAAALALCPLALHAQAIQPAQPAGTAAALQSQMVARHAMAAVAGAAPAAANPAPAPLRVTTGASRPELIKTAAANLEDMHTWLAIPRTMTVSMTVNEQGVPTDLKVLQSVNPLIDERVLKAVEQYRFKPSMLDGEPIARQLTLVVTIPQYGR